MTPGERRIWRIRDAWSHALTEGHFAMETARGVEPFYWHSSTQLGIKLDSSRYALVPVDPAVEAAVLRVAGFPDGLIEFDARWALKPYELAHSMTERMQKLTHMARIYGGHTLTLKDLAAPTQEEQLAFFGGKALPDEAKKPIIEHLDVLFAVARHIARWNEEMFA